MTFIDSSGLSVLAFVTKHLQARGGRLAISNPAPIARRVLDLSGLSPYLDIVEGEAPVT